MPFEFNLKSDGLTATILEKKGTCDEKARWWLKGLDPLASREGLPLVFGRVLHQFVEKVYEDLRLGRRKRMPKRSEIVKILDGIEKAEQRPSTAFTTALHFAEAVMPSYCKRFKQDAAINWIAVEEYFRLPYLLPDGRRTMIVGKVDGGFLNDRNRLGLLETKTKGRIDEAFLMDWLNWDLQTQIYLWALNRIVNKRPRLVLYNCVRRPQLRQGKNETLEAFASRCADDVRERPDWYFYRIPIPVKVADLKRFERELEERVTAFYDWWEGKAPHFRNSFACEGKYGICEYFDACAGRLEMYQVRPSREERKRIEQRRSSRK